ncbi:MAG: autotransporter outer membrane beta-barrel domain-containing protein, partial [Hyphomicrobiales bacterium]|nr:autotransporter outer membrane beta-barrel domain-containing protein [Hyphomicrobiales bacterium]
GVTVRVLAREEINAKTRGIDINQQGTGAIRIEASCSTDTVTTTDTCITAADEEGIRVQTATKTTGAIDITVAGEADRGGRTGTNKAIKSGKAGIDVIHAGSGALTIAANGEIESGEAGIFVHNGTIDGMSGTTGNTTGTRGNINITVGGEQAGTNRAIKSQADGIYLHQVGDGDATVTVNGPIETTMGHGVLINRDSGAGNATVMVNADITAGGSSGTNNGRSAIDIHFIHDANPSTPRTTTGDISVTIAEGVTVTGDHSPALDIGNFGSGDATITINGTVRRETTGDAGTVISLGAGSRGNLRLILGDGAIVEDGRATSNRDIEVLASSPAVATIELTGTRELTGTDRDKVLNLGDISGFDNLEKTGSGTWKLTGTQDSGNTGHNNFALNKLIVSEGTLVLDLDTPDGSEVPVLNFVCHKLNMDNTTCPSENLPVITIAQGAVLQADEDISMGGEPAFNLGGNLFLSGADSELEIVGLVATGTDASVTIDVEFPEAMEETDEADETEEEERPRFERARLNTGTSGNATVENPVVVNIMPTSTSGPPVSMDNLIRVGGTASLGEETFVAGNIVDSPVRLFLEHEEVEGVNVWNIIATQAGVNGGMGTIHDTFAATLSELSQPEMLYERLRDRKAKYGTNSWVKAYSANTQFTPEGSSFDIENAGFQIGLRAPMENILYQNWARNASFDASLEFGRAFSDALVASGTAEIHTETFAMGLGTTYNLDKFYIDGQLKYSYFENSLNAGTMRLASPGADSLAASIEFGSVLGGKGVSLGDIIGGVDAPGDPGIPNIELVPSLQVSWSSVDFGPYTSTTGIPVRLDDGDVFFGRVGMLAQGEWDNVHFLYDDFSVADVRLRGHVNFVAPLDAEVATEVMGMLITSKRVKPSLDAGIGIAYEWDDAYILHADITTQQGDEVEGYSGTIGFKHEF